MNEIKKLSSSQEDYLEAILILEQENRVARVKDISSMLSVQMPSVTGALKNLSQQKLINYEKNSFITLTPEGKKIAECVYSRHNIILSFFTEILGIEGKWVETQACTMEHSINHETANRLAGLTDWIKKTAFSEQNLKKEEWIDILKSRNISH